MFESVQVVADLDRVPASKVKGTVGCIRGYIRTTIVLEDILLKISAESLGEV